MSSSFIQSNSYNWRVSTFLLLSFILTHCTFWAALSWHAMEIFPLLKLYIKLYIENVVLNYVFLFFFILMQCTLWLPLSGQALDKPAHCSCTKVSSFHPPTPHPHLLHHHHHPIRVCMYMTNIYVHVKYTHQKKKIDEKCYTWLQLHTCVNTHHRHVNAYVTYVYPRHLRNK